MRDISDTAQCAVFIRGVGVNLNITEELLDLVPVKGATTGRDIFQGLEECIEKAALPWCKLILGYGRCTSNVFCKRW